MKSRNYDEYTVVDQLERKADLRIHGKQIMELSNGKGDVGIKSKGKIDFLVNYRHYVHFYVEKFK